MEMNVATTLKKKLGVAFCTLIVACATSAGLAPCALALEATEPDPSTDADVTASQTDDAQKPSDTAQVEPATEEDLLDVAVTIATADNPAYSVDVNGISTAENAKVQVWSTNDTAAQRFRIEHVTGTDFSVVYNTHSNLALTATGDSSGSSFVQASYEGDPSQLWRFARDESGLFSFISALSPEGEPALALSAQRADDICDLQLLPFTGARTQLWNVSQPTRAIDDGVYVIESHVAENRALDVNGAATISGANVQSWEVNGSNAQDFAIHYNDHVGYYEIANVHSGKALDVYGASGRNCTNIEQYDRNGTLAQYWWIDRIDDEAFRIVSAASGSVLDVNECSSDLGANVQIYEWNGTAAQRWGFARVSNLPDYSASHIVPDGRYLVRSAVDPSKALDINGCSRDSGANAQSYTANETPAQWFYVSQDWLTGYYTFVNVNSGKALDVIGAQTADGTNVWQYDPNGTTAQLWAIERHGNDPAHPFRIIAAGSGKALDVCYASKDNGANVQIWEPNDTVAQLWGFEAPVAFRANVSIGPANLTLHSSLANGVRYLFLPSYAASNTIDLSVLAPNSPTAFAYAPNASSFFATADQSARYDGYNVVEAPIEGGAPYCELLIRTSPDSTASLLRVMRSANIRAMFIASSDPLNEGRSFIESSATHDTRTSGFMTLVGADGAIAYDGNLSQIKGRGNWSWTESSKKPYQIKLGKKASLIDGSKENAAKTWVLLSNGVDESLMRNYIALTSAYEAGMPFTPECAFCDLYYDGEYRGMYLLSEKVQINRGRVEISEIENDSFDGSDIATHPTAQSANGYGMPFQYVTDVKEPDSSTGGYLLELDSAYYEDERAWFATSAGHFVIKSPEDASLSQVRRVSEIVQHAINVVSQSCPDVRDCIDLRALAMVSLTGEVSKDPDNFKTSCYFYLDENSNVLHVGPVWDFDFAFGSSSSDHVSRNGVPFSNPQGYALPFNDFFSGNPDYLAALQEIKNDVLDPYRTWVSNGTGARGDAARTIDDLRETLQASASMTATAVGVFPGLNRISFGSFDGAVDYLKSWLTQRLNWLDYAL